MNKSDFQYSVVLTSCGRFDLLRQTVKSFLQFADILPTQFIIVEDSGNEKVREILADFDFVFEFIITPKLGQAAAIDAGYAKVNTPFIFHCEDDWEFFRTGFVAESVVLLNHFPKTSAIMLRGRDERRELRKLPTEELNAVRFFRTYPKLHKRFFGYAYNPGLRRLADYKRIAPLAQVGNEGEVSFIFKKLGFYTVHLEIPAVCHLGWGRHVEDIAIIKSRHFFGKKIIRYKSKLKILKWRIFGLPQKWTDFY